MHVSIKYDTNMSCRTSKEADVLILKHALSHSRGDRYLFGQSEWRIQRGLESAVMRKENSMPQIIMQWMKDQGMCHDMTWNIIQSWPPLPPPPQKKKVIHVCVCKTPCPLMQQSLANNCWLEEEFACQGWSFCPSKFKSCGKEKEDNKEHKNNIYIIWCGALQVTTCNLQSWSFWIEQVYGPHDNEFKARSFVRWRTSGIRNLIVNG